MRQLTRSALAIATLVLAPAGATSADACVRCDCVATTNATSAMISSAVVFIGTARDASPTAPADSIPPGSDEPRVVTAFALDYTWKSDSLLPRAATTTLYVWSAGGDCDLPFVHGELYLVYAHRRADGRLETSRCDRTRSLADPEARADVRELYRTMRQTPDRGVRRSS